MKNTPRDRALHVLRHAKSYGQTIVNELRYLWHERMAICTLDGGLSEIAAEAVAIEELESVAKAMGVKF